MVQTATLIWGMYAYRSTVWPYIFTVAGISSLRLPKEHGSVCASSLMYLYLGARECPGMSAGSHPNLSGQERLSAFIKHRPTFLQLNKAATKGHRYNLKSRADSPIQLASFSIHYLFYSSLMNRLFPCHAISTNSLSICLTSFLSFPRPPLSHSFSHFRFFCPRAGPAVTAGTDRPGRKKTKKNQEAEGEMDWEEAVLQLGEQVKRLKKKQNKNKKMYKSYNLADQPKD